MRERLVRSSAFGGKEAPLRCVGPNVGDSMALQVHVEPGDSLAHIRSRGCGWAILTVLLFIGNSRLAPSKVREWGAGAFCCSCSGEVYR